ncbi:SIS domain-containing protein [Nonomuraea sp. NPDC050680]|uniref:SIS domain-containing protein n=1 Tax=Nonomuraea sp. NPDC050680 TaxID=3154630 RepID=UPI0033C09501
MSPDVVNDDLFRVALDELGAVLAKIDEGSIDAACRLIADARTIGVYGCGREALQIKGFAMRLYHLGLPVAVVGDMTMPALGREDVFLATSGPGESSTVLALMRTATASGATNLLLTAESESSAAELADVALVIPAQTMASDQGERRASILPMGSVYEGALFVLFEVMVLKLGALIGATREAMRARHTNME